MRILRSQYVKFQESFSTHTTTFAELQQVHSALPALLDEKQPGADENGNPEEAPISTYPSRRPSFFQSASKSLRICGGTIRKRRHTIIDCADLLRVRLNTFSAHVKVRIRFYDVGPQWYTQLYNDYRGQLWQRLLREVPTNWTKWYFRCCLCSRLLGSFTTLKAHLNLHLGLFPNHCGGCSNQYASRNSLLKHHYKTNHFLPGYQGNLKRYKNKC